MQRTIVINNNDKESISDEIKSLLRKSKHKNRLANEINQLTQAAVKNNAYRAYLDATRGKIKRLQAQGKDDEKTINKIIAKRALVIDAVTDLEVKRTPWKGGYDSYYAHYINNVLGLLSEVPYTFPFMYDMIWYSTAVFLIELCQIENPSETAIDAFSYTLTTGVFIANVLGFSASGEAKASVRARIDDPTDTLWSLMKKHPLLAAMMLKHFFDGSYLDVMQLVEPLAEAKYVLGPLILYAAMRYYTVFMGRDILTAETQESILLHMLKSLAKCDIRAVGADLYIGSVHLITILQRMGQFALAGFKEVVQFPHFFPVGKPDDTYAFVSAGISGVATFAPAEYSRGIALRARFHDPMLSEEEYEQALDIYNGRSWGKKLFDEFVNLIFSPSTFLTVGTGYVAYDNYLDHNYDMTAGFGALGLIAHLCYREAAKKQALTDIANELKARMTIQQGAQPNYGASVLAFLLAGSDQLSRIGSSVVSVLTLIVGDYYTSGGIKGLQNAPRCSVELLLLIYCASGLVAAGNLPYSRKKIEKTLMLTSNTLFATKPKALAAPVSSVAVHVDERKTPLLGESKQLDKDALDDQDREEEQQQSFWSRLCCRRRR